MSIEGKLNPDVLRQVAATLPTAGERDKLQSVARNQLGLLQMSPKRLRVLLFIGLSVVLICIISYGILKFVSDGFQGISEWAAAPNTCDPKTPHNTEELGQFKFPPSTRNLQSSCFGMQGWGGYAQFEISPSDLDFFVQNSKVTLNSGGTPIDNTLATKASALKSYLHGSFHTVYKSGKTFWQDVMVDTSDPNVYVVYVNFSGG